MASSLSRRHLLKVSIGLAGVAALPLLAACSQPSTGSGSTSAAASPAAASSGTAAPTAAAAQQPAANPTGATQAQAPASSSGNVTIRFHSWLEDTDGTFWDPVIKKFETDNPKITIKKEWFPRADLHTKELALAATGQIGDIVRINVAPLVTELKLKNVVQSVDSFVKADKDWAENDQKQFWPGNIATYSISGQQWGYPMVGHPGAIEYYFNIDHLKKAGAGMPPVDAEKLTFDYTKWKNDDLLAILPKATTKSSDGRISVYGIQPSTGGEGGVAVLRAFGGNYYNDEGTKCLINSKESVEGLQFLSDYWNKLKVAIPLSTKPDYTKTFPSGRVAFVVLTALAGRVDKLVGDKFKWTVAPPPIGPIGKPATQVSSDGIAISKITKNPAEAWAWIKVCVGKEVGIGRYVAGLGSPGSRYDVWTDPTFKKAAPVLGTIIYDNLIDPQKAPPLQPWSHPANGRYAEADTAMTNILQDVYLGNKKPQEAADAAYAAVQAIMDKPPA